MLEITKDNIRLIQEFSLKILKAIKWYAKEDYDDIEGHIDHIDSEYIDGKELMRGYEFPLHWFSTVNSIFSLFLLISLCNTAWYPAMEKYEDQQLEQEEVKKIIHDVLIEVQSSEKRLSKGNSKSIAAIPQRISWFV